MNLVMEKFGKTLDDSSLHDNNNDQYQIEFLTNPNLDGNRIEISNIEGSRIDHSQRFDDKSNITIGEREIQLKFKDNYLSNINKQVISDKVIL